MEKHYDINYLQNTRRLLESLKQESYNYFKGITDGTVVDLGCGAGNDVVELAKLVAEDVTVIGLDHDPAMIQRGKANSDNISNVRLILSEAYPLPFEDHSVSGLRTERLIQHLKDPFKTFEEI